MKTKRVNKREYNPFRLALGLALIAVGLVSMCFSLIDWIPIFAIIPAFMFIHAGMNLWLLN